MGTTGILYIDGKEYEVIIRSFCNVKEFKNKYNIEKQELIFVFKDNDLNNRDDLGKAEGITYKGSHFFLHAEIEKDDTGVFVIYPQSYYQAYYASTHDTWLFDTLKGLYDNIIEKVAWLSIDKSVKDFFIEQVNRLFSIKINKIENGAVYLDNGLLTFLDDKDKNFHPYAL